MARSARDLPQVVDSRNALSARVAEHAANRLFATAGCSAAGQSDVADPGVYSFPGSELIGRVVDTYCAADLPGLRWRSLIYAGQRVCSTVRR